MEEPRRRANEARLEEPGAVPRAPLESEAGFRTLSDSVPQIIWTNTPEGVATYLNRRWFEYTGLTLEESVGPGWEAVIHPDDAPGTVARWRETLRAGEIFETEYRLRRRDGVYRWHLGRNVPVRDPAGRITGWCGSATDIEDLKQAQAAERGAQEQFRLLVEGARDYAMFLLDPDNHVTAWNTGAERLFGYAAAEALGRPGSFIFTPEDRERGEPEREAGIALRDGRAADRRWHLRKDGSRFWADGLLMRLDHPGGELRGFAKVARDATDQRETEERLRHALEAVARANDRLEQRVAERTQELQQRTEELARTNELRQELLRELVTAQERERGSLARDLHDDTGQQVTGLLLGLSRLAKSGAVTADAEARETVTRLQALAQEVAEKSHRLAVALQPSIFGELGLGASLVSYADEWSRWSGIPVQVEQVGLEDRLPGEVETTIYRVAQEALTNVLRHAVEGAGERRATRVSVLLQRRGTEALTVIEDNGPGFDVEAVQALPPAERRLGIFGMQERARLAGGTLTIESAPGQGTTLFLRLPLPERTEKTGA